jgi:hypothetical protein
MQAAKCEINSSCVCAEHVYHKKIWRDLTGRASKFRFASVIIYPESVRVIMKISRQRRRKIITAIAMMLLLSAASVVAVQSTGPRRPRRWAVRPP